MFRYLTSYRCYTLAKAGLALAYLWFIADFFRIHLAFWNGLSLLLPDPAAAVADTSPWDWALRAEAFFIQSKGLVWIVLLASPVAAALFLWGRHKWLQAAVAAWLCLGMLAMVSFAGVFASAADVWLNLAFATYGLSALLSPAREWEAREPGFSRAAWRQDAVLGSTYAWLLVAIQFSVYFFAGISKLTMGWEPWTGGTALQNLAFDSSMRDFARGVPIPFAVSWLFCYATLFQRLVVPFGFCFMRYRGWAFLILAAMHLGYAVLMHVAIFPLVGLAFLFVTVPPRGLALPLFSRPSLRRPREVKKRLQHEGAPALAARIVLGLFTAWLLLESARIAVFPVVAWESRYMLAPAWKMFADGGVEAGRKWRLLLKTPNGEADGTGDVTRLLPGLWRDRFYLDVILHTVEGGGLRSGNIPPNSLGGRLLNAAPTLHGGPVLDVGFDIYKAPGSP